MIQKAYTYKRSCMRFFNFIVLDNNELRSLFPFQKSKNAPNKSRVFAFLTNNQSAQSSKRAHLTWDGNGLRSSGRWNLLCFYHLNIFERCLLEQPRVTLTHIIKLPPIQIVSEQIKQIYLRALHVSQITYLFRQKMTFVGMLESWSGLIVSADF